MQIKNVERKRTQIILEIMKQKGYEEGIKLQELYIEIQNHKNFLEYFENLNKGWKAAVRRLLQNSSPNSNHFNYKYKDFYFIVRGLWTYYGNQISKEDENKRNTVHKEIEGFITRLKRTDFTKEEKTAIVKTRINQTSFRKYLIKEFESCPLKKVNLKTLLVASHIIDYADCEEKDERANPYNGILLSPDVDKLFDKKIITFDPNDGHILINAGFEEEVMKMGLNNSSFIPAIFLNEQRKEFLKQRNKKYFQK